MLRIAAGLQRGCIDAKQAEELLIDGMAAGRAGSFTGRQGLEQEPKLIQRACDELHAKQLSAGVLISRGASDNMIAATPDAIVSLPWCDGSTTVAAMEVKCIDLSGRHLPLCSSKISVTTNNYQLDKASGPRYIAALTACQGFLSQCIAQSLACRVSRSVLVLWHCRRATIDIILLDFANDFLAGTLSALQRLAPILSRATTLLDAGHVAPPASADSFELSRQLCSRQRHEAVSSWLAAGRQEAVKIRTGLKAVGRFRASFFCFPAQAAIVGLMSGRFPHPKQLQAGVDATLRARLSMPAKTRATPDLTRSHSALAAYCKENFGWLHAMGSAALTQQPSVSGRSHGRVLGWSVERKRAFFSAVQLAMWTKVSMLAPPHQCAPVVQLT